MPNIQLTTIIEAPIERCFDLSRSIDLHKASMEKSGEKAIAGTTQGLIELNETVTWRAMHFGVKQKLTSKITAFDRPNYFVDEMVSGAFKSFRHEHHFTENDCTTVMKDVFEFASPYGLLGWLVNNLVLTRYVTVLLVSRNECIKRVAESEKWKEILP